MPKPYQLTVEQIAQRLKTRRDIDQETVLVLGSRAGGLFHSERFYDILGKYSISYHSFYQLSRTEQFTQCFEILTNKTFSETEIYHILKQSLNEVRVANADVCIADLILRGHFQEIISANGDNILERALQQYETREQDGMREPGDFEVVIPGRGLPGQSNIRPYCRLTKIFGDLHSRDYNITERSGCFQKNSAFLTFLQHILEGEILLIGLDPTWDEEILVSIPPQGGSVLIVSDEDPTKLQYYQRIIQTRSTGYLTGRDGSYKNFAATLYSSLYSVPPILQQRDTVLHYLQRLLTEQQAMREDIQHLHEDLKRIISQKEQQF